MPIKFMVGLFILGEVGSSILMLKFFFLIPIVTHITTALCLALAFLTLSAQITMRLRIKHPKNKFLKFCPKIACQAPKPLNQSIFIELQVAY
jgi:hypothetical protein